MREYGDAHKSLMQSGKPSRKPESIKQWEYDYIEIALDCSKSLATGMRELTVLGKQGWEVCGVIPPLGPQFYGKPKYILKREICGEK